MCHFPRKEIILWAPIPQSFVGEETLHTVQYVRYRISECHQPKGANPCMYTDEPTYCPKKGTADFKIKKAACNHKSARSACKTHLLLLSLYEALKLMYHKPPANIRHVQPAELRAEPHDHGSEFYLAKSAKASHTFLFTKILCVNEEP